MSPSLESGLEISHFRILSPLGEGGMGEVYRAWDTELEREVALKVLPPDRVGSEDRLRRFVKEAKAASALAHPNIITVYEIGHRQLPNRDSGEGVRDVHYIAMELVDGLTLKRHIYDERTDLKTLLGYLAQAAQGLGRAHEAGVVHRDLKPDNIMITRDGYAKVLDFGLAKLNTFADPDEERTDAPTLVEEATAEGAMMGTVGYMSPEQAQGRAVDHRTDVFSFGCLLYEAATSRRPFVADSSIDVLHKIVHDAPPAMEEVSPNVPGGLRRMVKRCLAKDPERRAQSMKDLGLELGELVDDFDGLSPVSTSGISAADLGAPAAAPKGGSRPGLWSGLGVGVLVALALGLGWMLRSVDPGEGAGPAADTASYGGFQAMVIEPLTSDGTITSAALSPDGRYLAHTRSVDGKMGLWIRQVSTGSDVQIVAPQDLFVLGVVFAPDGEHLYFVRNDPDRRGYRGLFRVPALGGEVRRIAFDVDAGVALSPDGSRLSFPRSVPEENRTVLLVASANGAGERELVSLEAPQRFLMAPATWSPDGSAIVTGVQMEEDRLDFRFVAIDVESGAMSPVAGDHRFARMSAIEWLPDGSGLILVARQGILDSADQIWIIEHPSGNLLRVSNDLNNYGGVSVSADGSALATVLTESVIQLYAMPADDPSVVRQLTTGAREVVLEVAAAAGGMVVVQRHRLDQVQLWEMYADGREARQLTSDGSAFNPALSDDGTVLVASLIFEDETPHVWSLDPETGARLEQLTTGGGEVVVALSPGGDWMLYRVLGTQTLWQRDLFGEEPRPVAERYNARPQISPDSSSFAYATFEEVDGESRPLIKIFTRGGEALQTLPWDLLNFYWHPDGEALVAIRYLQRVANLWRVPLDGSDATQITNFDRGFIVDADWSPDGEWLYVTRGETTSDVVLIKNFH